MLAVLMAVSSYSIRASRKGAQLRKCSTHARESMTWLSLYALDYKGFFPTWIGDGPAINANRRIWRAYAGQGFAVMHKRPWFEFTGLSQQSPTLRCPANQLYGRLEAAKVNNDYSITSAGYVVPAYMDPALPAESWRNQIGARVQQLDAAAFPSAKVGVFEFSVWHGWTGAYGENADLSGLDYFQSKMPGSVVFFDGHAEQRRPRPQPWVKRYPLWPYSPFDMTEWGLRGRDF